MQPAHHLARLKPEHSDIKALLKKHGHWYHSSKIRRADDWLIFFCFGAFVSADDVEVDWTREGEPADTALGQWETWCHAPRKPLAPASRFVTEKYHIRLRQWHTPEQHPVYLMEEVVTYLPRDGLQFWYVQEHGVVLATEQDGQPVGVFAEFRPRVPIVELSAKPSRSSPKKPGK
ncbi:MAG TPA: hypothetical protein VFB60_11450 [Ktedonobacteraceae bacterium]|nr:hypothetical protein [Ktedonobacteraceae bacterium]